MIVAAGPGSGNSARFLFTSWSLYADGGCKQMQMLMSSDSQDLREVKKGLNKLIRQNAARRDFISNASTSKRSYKACSLRSCR